MSNNPPSSNNNNMPTSFVNEGRRLATSPVTAKPITKRRKVNDNAKNDNDSKGKVKAKAVHKYIDPSSKYMVNTFLGTRYESINRYFRESQKTTEKNYLVMSTVLKKLISSIDNKTFTLNNGISKIEIIEKRLKDMEKKLLKTDQIQDASVQKLLQRCALLCKSTNSIEGYNALLEKHLNILIADYIGREGQINAAKAFAKLHGIDDYLDFDVFHEFEKIVTSLKKGRTCKYLIDWCNSNRSKLRKECIYLEMKCRVHEFSQLCLEEDKSNAVAYAVKHFSNTMKGLDSGDKDEFGNDGVSTSEHKMIEISKKAMGLLVFKHPATCGLPRYENMVSNSSWDNLIESFRQAWCVVTRIPNEPRLVCTLRIGLTVMKTAICKPNVRVNTGSKRKRGGSSSSSTNNKNSSSQSIMELNDSSGGGDGDTSKNRNQVNSLHRYVHNFSHKLSTHTHNNHDSCPVCDEHLGKFAANLPRAHKTQSMLICRLSGDVMDQSNPPMAFPNGQVYSLNAIKKMSVNDAVKCPNTGFTCTIDELRKVYIL